MSKYLLCCTPEDYYWHAKIEKWNEKNPFFKTGEFEYVIHMNSNPTDSYEFLEKRFVGALALFLLLGKVSYNPDWLADIANEARKHKVFIFVVKLPQESQEKPVELKDFKTISLNPNAFSKYIKLVEEKSQKLNPTRETVKEQNPSEESGSVDPADQTQ